jgi:CRISPR-associated protein Csm4
MRLMKTLKITITPRTAFGTPPQGDTIFGQLCWALLRRFGEDRLADCLEGYTEGTPFLVISDAFPGGYIPRPHLPTALMQTGCLDPSQRKQLRKQQWMPWSEIHHPLNTWQARCKSSENLDNGGTSRAFGAMHNTINRHTGTTGGDAAFTPYAVEQLWYAPDSRLDIYVILDPRLHESELAALFKDIGLHGFGRDASVGLGKFDIHAIEAITLPSQPSANAFLTLGGCSPQGQGFVSSRSYYQVFTRYGRHGEVAAISGKPFKNPVLLARAGGVFHPECYAARSFIGQGLGGNGVMSKLIEETVQQGYAPVIGICMAQDTAS